MKPVISSSTVVVARRDAERVLFLVEIEVTSDLR